MKIGILTYHRVVNVGSVIQAWCVVKIAQELYPDAKVEIIDYRPRRMEIRELKKFIKRRWPFINFRHFKKMKAVRRFVAENLPLTNQSVTTDNARKAMTWLSRQNYDLVMVGSDTIWELRDKAYSPRGVNAYFLPAHLEAKKVSIASSMDPVPELTFERRKVLTERSEWLKDFDVITLRDTPTQEALENVGFNADSTHIVPDPTLMVDWSSLVSKYTVGPANSKPIIGVALPASDAIFVHRLFSAQGYEVWDWNGVSSTYCDYALPGDLTISETLGHYRRLSGFVTDRFHGSIFSISVGGILPIFIEKANKWKTGNSKGRELLRSLGQERRVLRVVNIVEAEDALSRLVGEKSIDHQMNAKIMDVGNKGRSKFRELVERCF